MRKAVRYISLIPLICVMSILPFGAMYQTNISPPDAGNVLSLNRNSGLSPEAEVTEAGQSHGSANGLLVPLAALPTVASAQTAVPGTIGIINYYNQGDPLWADTLYGPKDPMKSHGCGPTAVAMIASSFTGQAVTPPDVAQWASENGYCSPGEGSKHELIPDGMAHYGLEVTSIKDRSAASISDIIKSGKVVVALMNKGHFTNGGHFLLLTQITEEGKVRIADPADWDNSSIPWDLQFILDEVRLKAEGGGPLWAVSMPPEI